MSLSFDGNLNWVSIPLEGAAAGSPLTSYDGRYVYLTHNSNFMSIGHFTVLDILGATTDTAIFPLYSEFNQTNPFSPPGIYHNPAEGYYDGGQGNTNDIVVWAHAPNPTEGGVGSGASFVFQFPMNYVGSSQAEARQADGQNQLSMPLYWNILGDEVKNWQSTSAPVLANYGRSLYWSVSRSQFRAWVGQAGSNVERFSRFRTSSPSFRRGNPPYVAPPNSPALSSNSTEPMIFVGSAGNEFVKMDYLMTEDTAIIRNTASSVSSRAIVSPDDEYVYFTEFTGFLHQARTSDLEDAWVQGGTAPLDGEFSLTSDGTMLIVGDVTGKITAYKVASSPTAPPTLAPTLAPTSEPTQPKPTGFRPTDNVPIPVPGSQPTSKPTLSPTFSPTGTPTDPPRQPTRPVESSSASAPTVTTSLLFAFTTLAVAFLSLLV